MLQPLLDSIPVYKSEPVFTINVFIYVLKIVFLDRGWERGRDGEKHQCVVASYAPHTRDLAHNPGKCSDWESNQRPFGLQAGTQSIHWAALDRVHICLFLNKKIIIHLELESQLGSTDHNLNGKQFNPKV